MKTQQGLSLIELMVALLLGSLITIAATQLFLVNRQTENLQMGITSVQDNGRFAFDYLSRELMASGYTSDVKTGALYPFAIDAGEYGEHLIQDGTKYDTISVVAENGTDCVGTNTFSGIKKFYVKDDADGKRLVCVIYEKVDDAWVANDSGPLVDNVESFQVLYGVDSNESGYADLYVTATVAKSLAARIVSVRFALLIASDGVVSMDRSLALESIDILDQTHVDGTDSDAGNVNFSDGRLYRVYTSTVALRNVMEEI